MQCVHKSPLARQMLLGGPPAFKDEAAGAPLRVATPEMLRWRHVLAPFVPTSYHIHFMTSFRSAALQSLRLAVWKQRGTTPRSILQSGAGRMDDPPGRRLDSPPLVAPIAIAAIVAQRKDPGQIGKGGRGGARALVQKMATKHL